MQSPNDIVLNDDELIREVSPNDEMYASDKNYRDWYWIVGRSAIECISRCMAATGKRACDVTQILDFPCGHGRVLRYLKLAFPNAKITACDLSRDGVDFCASTFGAVPAYSHKDLSQIGLPSKAFDLVWVGSLFTHFDAARWASFLELFASSLREDGLLVFSTHGRSVYRRLREIGRTYNYGLPHWRKALICYSYERHGKGYGDYLGVEEFGVSLSDPAWVCDQIRQIRELTLIHFSAGAWDVQDIYACRKLPASEIGATSSNAYWQSKVRDLTPRRFVELAKTIGFRRRRE